MSRPIKLLFFLSTTLFINTASAMQQPVDPQAEVQTLVASFAHLKLEDGNFSPLPQEIVHNIIHLAKRDYPWEDVIQFVQMRTVCKRWLSILSSMDAIVKHLKIPPLHFAAIQNKAEKMMRLKLTNACSLLEPDCRGFRAAHYALATKAHDAMTILKIGTALNTSSPQQKLIDLLPFVPNDPETMKIVCAQYNKNYTVEELANFITTDNILGLQEALSKIQDSAVIIELLTLFSEKFTDTNPFKILLCFALASKLECTLFEALNHNVNLGDCIPPMFNECGANPNTCDELGRTLLARACLYPELLPTVTELLKCENIDVNLPSKDEAMRTPLHVAALANNIQAAQKLLEFKDNEGKCRANINAKDGYDHTPLYIATESDKTYELFNLLLKHGADINIIQDGKKSFAPIHFAAQNGCIKILETLVNNPTCNIELLNAHGYTALGMAATCDQKTCVKFLLQKKANASCRDKLGNTLLHHTTRKGHIKSMRKLIPYMSHLINTPNHNSFAPLHIAAMKANIECTQLLLNAGAKVGIKTKNGDTPLHYAASNNNVPGIELLSTHGACIDAQNNKTFIFKDMNVGGYTPLHCAAHRGHLQAIEKLVELGANIHAKTTLGKTALNLAYDFGHQEVRKYLAGKMHALTLEFMHQEIKNY